MNIINKMSKEIIKSLNIKKCKNFWYLQEEAKFLKKVWKDSNNSKDGYEVTFRQDSMYFSKDEEAWATKNIIDNLIKLRESLEALWYVAKKLPKEGGVYMNKELYFRGEFKKLCEYGDDILHDLAYQCIAIYSGVRSGQIIDVSMDLANLAYSTGKRLWKLNDILTDCCEE